MGKSPKDFSLDLYAYYLALKFRLKIKEYLLFFLKEFMENQAGIMVCYLNINL